MFDLSLRFNLCLRVFILGLSFRFFPELSMLHSTREVSGSLISVFRAFRIPSGFSIVSGHFQVCEVPYPLYIMHMKVLLLHICLSCSFLLLW